MQLVCVRFYWVAKSLKFIESINLSYELEKKEQNLKLQRRLFPSNWVAVRPQVTKSDKAKIFFNKTFLKQNQEQKYHLKWVLCFE